MDTKKFWEDRLSKGINLLSTGHRAFSIEYNQWLYQTQVDCLDELIKENRIDTKDASFLDIGCGGGFFIEYFAQKGASPIFGVDITRQSIEYLREKYSSYYFYESDISAEQLPFEGSFQIVAAINVMYHIVNNKKFEKALDNICSLLTPGGYLILYDTFQKNLFPSPKHVCLRDLPEYDAVFRTQGIQIQAIKPAYYLLNRVYIPIIGPFVINTLRLGKLFYSIDKRLRQRGIGNLGGTKFLIARKER